MKLGREVSRHNELDNWRNTHRFESVMATTWLLLTISETEPGLWDRLIATILNNFETFIKTRLPYLHVGRKVAESLNYRSLRFVKTPNL